jgi:hypothetical protein
MTPISTPNRRRAAARPASEAPREKRVARRKAATLPDPNPTASKPPTPATKDPGGKLGIVVALMRRPEGATAAQMGEATGWQAHSVRGALAGALKRKHKLTIVGEPGDGGRVYRIAAEQPA